MPRLGLGALAQSPTFYFDRGKTLGAWAAETQPRVGPG